MHICLVGLRFLRTRANSLAGFKDNDSGVVVMMIMTMMTMMIMMMKVSLLQAVCAQETATHSTYIHISKIWCVLYMTVPCASSSVWRNILQQREGHGSKPFAGGLRAAHTWSGDGHRVESSKNMFFTWECRMLQGGETMTLTNGQDISPPGQWLHKDYFCRVGMRKFGPQAGSGMQRILISYCCALHIFVFYINS
jgi:hypothetical protein